MLIELSEVLSDDVVTAEGKKLGVIDRALVDGRTGRVAGFQVSLNGVIKRFAGLNYVDVLEVNRHSVIVDQPSSLSKNLKDFDIVYKNFGSVVGVAAKTESGRGLGKVSDLLFEIESGLIVRFYLRNLLAERIIPREYMVSITPKQIVFRDIVDQPIFDSIAAQAAPTN
ncbi:MAG TPA: PRC-barrel domain-containing protein [Candidatus Saccharimonadales bacterium]|nr:PRC-barrel domain-containing protein [Candidatus Saccharimonadales bacterium]